MRDTNLRFEALQRRLDEWDARAEDRHNEVVDGVAGVEEHRDQA